MKHGRFLGLTSAALFALTLAACGTLLGLDDYHVVPERQPCEQAGEMPDCELPGVDVNCPLADQSCLADANNSMSANGGTSTGADGSLGEASPDGGAAGGGGGNGGTDGSGGSGDSAEVEPGDGGTSGDGQCSPNPCQNGGLCSTGEGAARCACADGFAGPTCTARALALLVRTGCRAEGVGSTGELVVGSCTAGGMAQAMRWTGNEDDDATLLPFLSGGERGGSMGTDASGHMIVGWSEDSAGNEQAVRWVDGTVVAFSRISSIDSHQDRALRTTSDGRFIVGETDRAGEYDTAVRWDRNNNVSTIVPSGMHEWCEARGVSADGTTVVGFGIEESGAFIWTSSIGYSALPGLTASNSNRALGISADGRLIIGTSAGVAVRWIERVPESLGGAAEPLGVSADGSVIVGRMGSEAFLWTEPTGMRTLSAVLESLDVDLNGFVLASATDVSADGTVVVGYGTRNGSEQAFRVILPAP